MKKLDCCYAMQTPDGPMRVQAAHEPDIKRANALLELYRAASAYMEKHPEDSAILLQAIRELGNVEAINLTPDTRERASQPDGREGLPNEEGV